MDYLAKYTKQTTKKKRKQSQIIINDLDQQLLGTPSPNTTKNNDLSSQQNNNIYDQYYDEEEEAEGPVVVDEHTGLPINVRITTAVTAKHGKEISQASAEPSSIQEGYSPNDGSGHDLSPPRRDAEPDDLSPPRRPDSDSDLSPPRNPEGAEPNLTSVVYRDKTGKRIDEAEWAATLKPKKLETPKVPRVTPEWGKGLVQIESAKDKAEREAKTIAKPFANADIDEEYDSKLKDKLRWDDPMLKFDPEAAKEILKQEEDHADGKPKCRFQAPPNRFDIPPGYRWDGVVRGNGYEERRFREIARRKAKEEQTYINNIAED